MARSEIVNFIPMGKSVAFLYELKYKGMRNERHLRFVFLNSKVATHRAIRTLFKSTFDKILVSFSEILIYRWSFYPKISYLHSLSSHFDFRHRPCKQARMLNRILIQRREICHGVYSKLQSLYTLLTCVLGIGFRIIQKIITLLLTINERQAKR